LPGSSTRLKFANEAERTTTLAAPYNLGIPTVC
jgi:hypothetical protein